MVWTSEGPWPADSDSRALAGRAALVYGSGGWGFESLRARPDQRLIMILLWPSLLANGLSCPRTVLVALGPVIYALFAVGGGVCQPRQWSRGAHDLCRCCGLAGRESVLCRERRGHEPRTACHRGLSVLRRLPH